MTNMTIGMMTFSFNRMISEGCIAIECGGQGGDLEDARKSVEFVKGVLAE